MSAGNFVDAHPLTPHMASPSIFTIASVTVRIISCFWALSKTPSMT